MKPARAVTCMVERQACTLSSSQELCQIQILVSDPGGHTCNLHCRKIAIMVAMLRDVATLQLTVLVLDGLYNLAWI